MGNRLRSSSDSLTCAGRDALPRQITCKVARKSICTCNTPGRIPFPRGRFFS